VIVGDDPDREEYADESADILAPVPTVGFFVDHALTRDLILEFRTTFIDLEISGHSGRIFTTRTNLTWFFTRHVGVGLDVAASDLSYERTSGEERLKVDVKRSSLSAQVTVVC
jgi:hypothetical protein